MKLIKLLNKLKPNGTNNEINYYFNSYGDYVRIL